MFHLMAPSPNLDRASSLRLWRVRGGHLLAGGVHKTAIKYSELAETCGSKKGGRCPLWGFCGFWPGAQLHSSGVQSLLEPHFSSAM